MTAKKVVLTQNNVDDASKAELLTFASLECVIEFSDSASRTHIVSEICKAQGWAESDPRDSATHVEVQIAKQPGDLGEMAYRGGFNGKMFSIPRDIPTVIPIEYFNTILDSQNRGFTIQTLSKFKEQSPTENRITASGAQMSVLRYITK